MRVSALLSLHLISRYFYCPLVNLFSDFCYSESSFLQYREINIKKTDWSVQYSIKNFFSAIHTLASVRRFQFFYLNHFSAFGLRCGHPGKQQWRFLPSLTSSCRHCRCSFQVFPCFTIVIVSDYLALTVLFSYLKPN